MREKLNFPRFLIVVSCSVMLALVPLASCKRVERGTPQKVLDAIEQVRQNYCPDRRLEVFDITAETRGANLKLLGEVSNPAARQALLKALKSAARGFKIEEEIALLPSPQLGKRRLGIVNVSVANLRAQPRHSAELVNQMLLGSSVELLKQKNNWFYGRVEDGYLGWLTAGSIVRADSFLLAEWQGSDLAMFVEFDGKIRSKPDDTSLPVSDAVLGGLLRRSEAAKTKTLPPGWAQVELPDRRIGYLPSQSLSGGTPRAVAIGAAARLVNTAQRFLGIPYLWGGTTVNGFDCSGFTQTVFLHNGIHLLRDASQQTRGGAAVEIDENFANLRAGDLLFFGNSPEKITHVAISLSGARFIHASEIQGFVRINSLDPNDADYDAYRARTLQFARRYLKEPVPISGSGRL